MFARGRRRCVGWSEEALREGGGGGVRLLAQAGAGWHTWRLIRDRSVDLLPEDVAI
jgi:hypothetical protein